MSLLTALLLSGARVEKSQLRVIHFSSNSDLPQSIRDKVSDAVGQTIFRQALNDALAHDHTEMHGYISGYKALESAGYIRNDDDEWIAKQGGPAGIQLPGEEEPDSSDYTSRPEVLSTDTDDVSQYMEYLERLAKSTPTLQQSHANRPLGSDDWPIVGVNRTDPNQSTILVGNDEEKDDDPGTQFINPEQDPLMGATIQNPYDQRNQDNGKVKTDEEKDDDPGTQDVDPPHTDYAGAPNYAAITSFQGAGNRDPANIYKGGPGSGPRPGTAKTGLEARKLLDTLPTIPLGENFTGSRYLGLLEGKTFTMPKPMTDREFRKTPVEAIDPRSLTLAQNYLDKSKISDLVDSDHSKMEPITITRQNGRNIVIDGTHRAVAAYLKGTESIPVQVNNKGVDRVGKFDVVKRISGSSDIHLNKEGAALAAKLGVRIADKGCFDLLYSSPLNRGKETAHEILEACPHTTFAAPNQALQPWHLGEYEGQSGDKTTHAIGFYVDNPDERPPGKGADDKQAETFNESKDRQLTFWKDLYDDWQNDPTLKIGVVCHSRGLALLQAWVDKDCPTDFDVDANDIHDPDKDPHATVYRWHKDKIDEVDVEDDDPLKPGIYPILHSLTDDDSDEGNEDLSKGGPGSGPKSGKVEQKYLPPIEVQRAAKSAYDVGSAVIGITEPLSDGTGLTEEGIHEISKHFSAVESATDTETTRNAWGGPLAHKWVQRVIKKIERDYPKWIAVDLDGTLAKPLESYDGTRIGDPIPGAFFDKVKQAVSDGKPIRILTARVANDPNGKIANAIKAWTLKYLGKELSVTNEKDPGMTEIWDDKAHHPDEITKAGSGVMVAFTIDPDTAAKLKVKDGEDPSGMHVTLVYLGKEVQDDKIKALTTMLKGFAGTFAPIEAIIAGPIRFAASDSSDAKDVCVASVESKSLHKFREDLLNKVESLGIEVKKNFSYNPHVTVKYIDPKDDLPVQRIQPILVMFKAITLYDQGDTINFPLSGTAIAKLAGTGTIIECVDEGDWTWAHVSCEDGTRVALSFENINAAIQIGDHVRWDGDEVSIDNGTEPVPHRVPLLGISKATGSKEGTWITVNGQHILVGADGKPLAGNPKVLGQRNVSTKVERARKNAVLTGKHEQDIADKSEEKISKALGIPRTKDNSAFDLRNDDVGIEIKTMTHGKNDKITMGKTALGRKLAEAQAEGLKTFTVVADMRGRSQAQYYVREGLGSFRVGSMTPVTLSDLKEMVKM